MNPSDLASAVAAELTRNVHRALAMVEEIREGGKYCSACRAVTNHRAIDHESEEEFSDD